MATLWLIAIAVVAGVVYGGISAFRRPGVGGGPPPVFAGGRDEKRFGFDLDINTTDESAPTTPCYGTVKFGGALVSYLSGVSDGSDQWVNLLLDLGEGPYPPGFIQRIPETNEHAVFINEKPATDYSEIYWQSKRGDHLQSIDEEFNGLSDPIEGQTDPNDKTKIKDNKKDAKTKVVTGGQKTQEKNLSKKQQVEKVKKQKAIDADIIQPGITPGDPIKRFDKFNFDDQVAITNNHNVKISDTEWTEVTFSPELLSAEEVYVGLHFQGLFNSASDGGLSAVKIEFRVRWREKGSEGVWTPDSNGALFFVRDRSTAEFNKEVQIINLEDQGGVAKKWQVQVQRVKEEDKNQTQKRDRMFLAWGREVNKTKLAYPFNAVLAVRVKATDQISGGVPNVFAIFKGREVYDPRDGSVKWSDNPAICSMDWLTSGEKTYDSVVAAVSGFDPAYTNKAFAQERGFGLGQKIHFDDLDVPSFVEAANYFDEFIRTPTNVGFEEGTIKLTEGSSKVEGNSTLFRQNGIRKGDRLKVYEVFYEVFQSITDTEVELSQIYSGATTQFVPYELWEPRSRLDLVLTKRQSALEQVREMTTPFGGFLSWVAGKIRYGVEKDDEPAVQIFTPENYYETSLEVSITDIKEKFNAITVRYFDAATQYSESSAALFDEAAILAGDEVNHQQYELNGVSRRSEAFRSAAYQLNVSKLPVGKITFQTGANAFISDAGDVIGLVSPKDGFGDYDSEGNFDLTTAVKFRIVKISKGISGEVDIEATQYDDKIRSISTLSPVKGSESSEMPSAKAIPDPPEAIRVAEIIFSGGPAFDITVLVPEFADVAFVQVFSRNPNLPTEEQIWEFEREIPAIGGAGKAVRYILPGLAGTTLEFGAVIGSKDSIKSSINDSPTAIGSLNGDSYQVPDVPFVQLSQMPNETVYQGLEPSFEWPDVARLSSSEGIGVDEIPIASGGRDPRFDSYQVIIKTGSPLAEVRKEFTVNTGYVYTLDKNQDDHSGQAAGPVTIEVSALDVNGNLSIIPAILSVTQEAIGNPTQVQGKATNKGVQFQWKKPQNTSNVDDRNFDHYLVTIRVGDPGGGNMGAAVTDEIVTNNKYLYQLTDTEVTDHTVAALVEIVVKAVAHNGTTSSGTAAVSVNAQTIKGGDIDPSVFQTTVVGDGVTDLTPLTALINNDLSTVLTGTLDDTEFVIVILPTEITVKQIKVWTGTFTPDAIYGDMTIGLSIDGVTYTTYQSDGGGTPKLDTPGVEPWFLTSNTKNQIDFVEPTPGRYVKFTSTTDGIKLKEIRALS